MFLKRSLLSLLCVGSFSLPALASTITVYSNLDGYIRSSGSNFSNDTSLFGKTVTSGDYLNGLFVFNLAASLPEGAVVESLSLSLFADSADGTSLNTATTFSLYQSLRNFTSSATWTNFASGQAWQTAGGTGNQDRGTLLSTTTINPTLARGTEFIFATSSAFMDAANDALDADGNLYLWMGIADSIAYRSVLRAVSNEGSITLRPRLNVTYSVVPEPSLSLVLISGIGVFAAFQRRKQG